jgi:hypothetical protein
MHHVTAMLKTHPQATPNEALARCIQECVACALACTSCADACLAEDQVEALVHCIRLNLDCADVCGTTGRVLTRQTSPEPRLALHMLEACAQACRVCAEECERHAREMDMMEHCRVCAETCRRCEQACEELRGSIGSSDGEGERPDPRSR